LRLQRLLDTGSVIGVVLSVAAALVGCFAFEDLRVLGAALAWLAGGVLRIRRGQVEGAMGRALGPAAPADRMYASLATGVMELLWLAGGPRRDLSRVTAFEPGAEVRIREALAAGRGAVFAASHTGNWELAACALAETVPLSVLVKRVSMGAFDRFMWGVRNRYGVGLLEGEGALRTARREVEKRRAVAVLIDQVPPREEHGDWLAFLGADALTDRAAAALAASTGAPLIVTAQRRREDGRHVLQVLRVMWPPTRGRGEWAREATRTATDELAAFVTRYPDQWLWMHRRWKQPSARADVVVHRSAARR
jgi:KDO2-lipid IV(A) lauroyltransferase